MVVVAVVVDPESVEMGRRARRIRRRRDGGCVGVLGG